jgi:hypothetical protein
MIKNFWLCLLLFCSATAFSQYTEIINSSRPGFAETPYAVGTGITQLEAGYQFAYLDVFTPSSTIKSNLFTQTLRFGLFSERLEFDLEFSQERSNIFSNNTPYEVSRVLGSYGIGVKYLILNAKVKNRNDEIRSWKKRTAFHWTMLVPSIGVKASSSFGIAPKIKEHANITIQSPESIIDLTNTTATSNPSGNIKFGLFLQNHIKESWVIVSNFSYERRFYNSDNRTDIYNIIFATSYHLKENWSLFGESNNVFKDNQKIFDFRTGVAYLWNRNIQFDLSLNANTSKHQNLAGGSLGFSWRLDGHIDKPIKIKSPKQSEEKEKKENFFKRTGQSSKEFIIIASISVGEFFNNAAKDVSIFTQNIFLKKENHIPKRTKRKQPKKEAKNTPQKPKRGKLLIKEKSDYKSGKTLAREKEKQRKAEEEKFETERKALEKKKAEELKNAEEKEVQEKIKADLKKQDKIDREKLKSEKSAKEKNDKERSNDA